MLFLKKRRRINDENLDFCDAYANCTANSVT